MSDQIIKIENISKKYIINHEVGAIRYTALRDVLSQNVGKIFRPFLGNPKNNPAKEEFWALKDVTFEVNQGDRIGIIGRNGAGKSTLLKILSRITEPTSGRISINGRVASLLEVGTGFHPELTGRENIFLNGAILGMSRLEIKKHFDAIVEFAEVEKFLDTPVKRYSSGMYVRLAFAVAAHLEPEILIIDEVLAVGDAQFQKKCLGKMEDVSKNEGRTVLFVSHNMGALKSLCNKAVILNKGQMVMQGDLMDSISHYFRYEGAENSSSRKFKLETEKLGKRVYLQEAEIELIGDTNLSVGIKMKVFSKVKSRIGINIRMKDNYGFPIGYGGVEKNFPDLIAISLGENKIILHTTNLNLGIGTYKISIELVIPGSEYLDKVEDCLTFSISDDEVANRTYYLNQNWGYGSVFMEIKDVVNESI